MVGNKKDPSVNQNVSGRGGGDVGLVFRAREWWWATRKTPPSLKTQVGGVAVMSVCVSCERVARWAGCGVVVMWQSLCGEFHAKEGGGEHREVLDMRRVHTLLVGLKWCM